VGGTAHVALSPIDRRFGVFKVLDKVGEHFSFGSGIGGLHSIMLGVTRIELMDVQLVVPSHQLHRGEWPRSVGEASRTKGSCLRASPRTSVASAKHDLFDTPARIAPEGAATAKELGSADVWALFMTQSSRRIRASMRLGGTSVLGPGRSRTPLVRLRPDDGTLPPTEAGQLEKI
jgi:hypothetical protein